MGLRTRRPSIPRYIRLYFPVTADVRRRAAYHSAWTLLVSVCDARTRLWASGQLVTVFFEDARAAPVSLRKLPGPGLVSADRASVEEPGPRSLSIGRAV